MSSSAEDPRYRTKVYLDTYLASSNLTDDDGLLNVKFIVCFDDPDYPVSRMFLDKFVDLVFSVGEPARTALLDYFGSIYGYEEKVPITFYAIDKEGITADKLKWKAEAELRRIVETYPVGSGSWRALEKGQGNDLKVESIIIRSTKWILRYKRNTA